MAQVEVLDEMDMELVESHKSKSGTKVMVIFITKFII